MVPLTREKLLHEEMEEVKRLVGKQEGVDEGLKEGLEEVKNDLKRHKQESKTSFDKLLAATVHRLRQQQRVEHTELEKKIEAVGKATKDVSDRVDTVKNELKELKSEVSSEHARAQLASFYVCTYRKFSNKPPSCNNASRL